MDNNLFIRGEIYYLGQIKDIKGSEQKGDHPVLILQNDELFRSTTVIVAFITSKLDKKGKAAHVWLPEVDGLPKKSMVLCEQIRTIEKSRLEIRLGSLDAKTMNRVDRALKYSLGIKSVKQKKEETTIYDPRKEARRPKRRSRKEERNELLSRATVRRIPKAELDNRNEIEPA